MPQVQTVLMKTSIAGMKPVIDKKTGEPRPGPIWSAAAGDEAQFTPADAKRLIERGMAQPVK